VPGSYRRSNAIILPCICWRGSRGCSVETRRLIPQKRGGAGHGGASLPCACKCRKVGEHFYAMLNFSDLEISLL